MSGCRWSEDGLHRWRFGVSRLAGTPHYSCGAGCPIVLPGDDIDEDAFYMEVTGGLMMAACAGCDAEVEVGEGCDGFIIDLPEVGHTVVCLTCGPDEADARADLAAHLAERYGEVTV